MAPLKKNRENIENIFKRFLLNFGKPINHIKITTGISHHIRYLELQIICKQYITMNLNLSHFSSVCANEVKCKNKAESFDTITDNLVKKKGGRERGRSWLFMSVKLKVIPACIGKQQNKTKKKTEFKIRTRPVKSVWALMSRFLFNEFGCRCRGCDDLTRSVL